MKESDRMALSSTIAVSTTIISVNLITVYIAANYFGLISIVTNKSLIIIFMVIIGFINFYFFIRRREYLNFNFKKDRKGGILIVAFIILTFALTFSVVQINRTRIFKERKDDVFKASRKESLEGKIRKWFE